MSEGEQFKVAFVRSGVNGTFQAGESVLEAGERLGLKLYSGCRNGICTTCKLTLLSGDVEMECDIGLQDADREKGMILACQASPRSDLEVEA